MRKVLWLASVLVLLLAPAALAEPAPAAAANPLLLPAGECAGGATATTSGESGSAGLEELELFAPEKRSMQPPMCPTPSTCPSACPPGPFCALGNLGQCCTTPSGLIRCCPPGKTIRVVTCPCAGCPGLSQVTVSCV